MKLRIKGNSIRLRLTKTDIETLAANGLVKETTHFGTTAFGYILQKSTDAKTLQATYKDSRIAVNISPEYTFLLTGTDQVGVETKQVLPDGDALYILVEKDFKCLDDVAEDQSDMYENPNA